jgi:membrane-associated phospholipid phosphatase
MTTTTAARPATSNAAGWAFLLFLTACLGLVELADPVPITLRGIVPLTLSCAILWAVAYYYRCVRPVEKFAEMCVSLSQVLLFSAVGIVLSYLAVRTNAPLWDDAFVRWDEALGFDWMSTMRLVDTSPTASFVLFVAYGSLIPQIVFVVCALGFLSKLADLRTVMLAAMLCGGVCILISAFMPAVAYPIHYGITKTTFEHAVPWAGFIKLGDFMSLRDGTIARLDFANMQGLITFPSYHAGLSAVTFWGFYRTRLNWLRLPGMTLAFLTIISTPVFGGHYLVDVIAGVVLAAFCLLAARRMIRWDPSLDWLRASPSRRSRAASAR